MLPEPLARPLQIRHRFPQKRPRLCLREALQTGVVELSQILIAEMHAVYWAGPNQVRVSSAIYLAASNQPYLASA